MKHSPRIGSRPRAALLLGLLALLLAVLAPARTAQAHPADVYLQASYITIAPEQIVVELDLTPGVLVAPAALKELDPNGDQQITESESRAYAEQVLQQIVLQLNGQQLPLQITKIETPSFLAVQTGYGTLRIFSSAALPAGLTGTQQIEFHNGFAPAGSAYQVNTFVEHGAAITLGKQNRDETQQRLSVNYTIGATTAAATPAPTVSATAGVTDASAIPSAAPAQLQQLLAFLQQPTHPPAVLLLALALTVLLGALHALTPGHGKTLVAAYLVGSQGTIRDAVVLGLTVTVTHTASVVLFGTLALVASQAVAATTLAAALELCAALLVLGLGARLVWARSRTFATGGAGMAFAHNHPHPHVLPGGGKRPTGLLSLGLAGGALPCPEALAILLLAVGVGQIGFGLGLLLAFSAGLAGVLIALGVLLVRAEGRLKRFSRLGTAWQRWLPLGSAVIVFVVGVAMLLAVLQKGAIAPATLLAVVGAAGLFAAGYGAARLRDRKRPAGTIGEPAWLPPRYQGRTVSAAPMGAAELK